MKISDLVIGKYYWYRWAFDCHATSGLLIGFNQEKNQALFKDENEDIKCRVVNINDVHCEDCKIISNRPKFSLFRMW